jgi:hypothetical protein
VLPRRDDLLSYADVTLSPYGALRTVLRDGRRMSAEQVRTFIVRLRPDFTPEHVEELVRLRLTDMRTKDSERRVSVYDADVEDTQVTLECRGCGSMPKINRRKLAITIERADRSGEDVYVSPGGKLFRRLCSSDVSSFVKRSDSPSRRISREQ